MEAVKWANGGREISGVGDEARRQESFAACQVVIGFGRSGSKDMDPMPQVT
jgi:hypothetical protein